MNEGQIYKIAQSVTESLIAARKVEIEKSAVDQAIKQASELISRNKETTAQEIIESVKNLVPQTVQNVISQEIPAIIDRIIPEIESSVQESVKNIEDRISELSNRIEEIAASSEAKNQESNFNYEIEDPDGGQESSTFMEIGFDSPNFHVLAVKDGRLFWLATEDCQTIES
jgi:hypothetical protein